MRVVKIFGSYLLVSLTALLTLDALGKNPSGLALIFYPLIGAFVLFMAYASNQYESRKEASATMNWQMIERLEKDSWFEAILMFGVIIFYVITLFIPAVAVNRLNEWLFQVIDWIFNLPVIGWLIGIGGVFLLFNIIFYGLFAMGFVIASILGKFRKEKMDNNPVIEKKKMTYNKKKNVITLITAAFLFLALFNGWPYGFFTLLRFVVFAAAIYTAWMAYKQRKEKWVWIFGFLTVLFNPFIVIHLNREIWSVIDLIVRMFMIISVFVFKLKNNPEIHD